MRKGSTGTKRALRCRARESVDADALAAPVGNARVGKAAERGRPAYGEAGQVKLCGDLPHGRWLAQRLDGRDGAGGTAALCRQQPGAASTAAVIRCDRFMTGPPRT